LRGLQLLAFELSRLHGPGRILVMWGCGLGGGCAVEDGWPGDGSGGRGRWGRWRRMPVGGVGRHAGRRIEGRGSVYVRAR